MTWRAFLSKLKNLHADSVWVALVRASLDDDGQPAKPKRLATTDEGIAALRAIARKPRVEVS